MKYASRHIPVVREMIPWQAANSMLNDPLRFLLKQSHYNGIFRVDAPVPLIVVHTPDYIRHVLQKNSRNYEKGPAYRGLSTLVGNGILTSEEDHWRKQRKMIQPSFNKARLLKLESILFNCAEQKAQFIQKNIEEKIDLKSIMTDYALDVIGTFVMGKELIESYKPKLLPLLLEQYDFAMMQNRTFFKFPLWVPTQKHSRFFKRKNELRELIHLIVVEKKIKPDDSVLSEMIGAKDSDDNGMKFNELHDDLLTLFVTGFETTANALSWIFILLAQYPVIQEELFEEICPVKNGPSTTLKSLMDNEWLIAVINEALRLYPPVWGYPRRSKEADEIDGYAVPRKSHIHLSVFMAHRNPEYWNNPNDFRPGRFMKSYDSTAFFPFGMGSRMCIGEHLAQLEIISFLYSIISKFKFELTSEKPIEMLPLITLHPKGDVFLNFKIRNHRAF